MTFIPLDHGVLNVPLHKRCNIDAQIDRYKAEQARIKQAKSAEHKSRKEAAIKPVKLMYQELTTAQLRVAAKKHDTTVREMRIMLKVEISYKPEKAQKLIEYIIGLSA